jgi:hypothetical protein
MQWVTNKPQIISYGIAKTWNNKWLYSNAENLKNSKAQVTHKPSAARRLAQVRDEKREIL